MVTESRNCRHGLALFGCKLGWLMHVRCSSNRPPVAGVFKPSSVRLRAEQRGARFDSGRNRVYRTGKFNHHDPRTPRRSRDDGASTKTPSSVSSCPWRRGGAILSIAFSEPVRSSGFSTVTFLRPADSLLALSRFRPFVIHSSFPLCLCAPVVFFLGMRHIRRVLCEHHSFDGMSRPGPFIAAAPNHGARRAPYIMNRIMFTSRPLAG